MTQSTDLEFADIVKPLEWEEVNTFNGETYFTASFPDCEGREIEVYNDYWTVPFGEDGCDTNGGCTDCEDGKREVEKFLYDCATTWINLDKIRQYKARIAELEAENKELHQPVKKRGAAMTFVHRIKVEPRHYEATARKEKLFEVRVNDRSYQKGDIVELVKVEVLEKGHTISKEAPPLRHQITYILQGGFYGIDPQCCVLGLSYDEVQP